MKTPVNVMKSVIKAKKYNKNRQVMILWHSEWMKWYKINKIYQNKLNKKRNLKNSTKNKFINSGL